ncbi:MAG: GNAT family N-acetyltransferase [Candidatus Rokubacteria bacterium]|nr:GNAT family N-acetyltransferase [Candidatus Rokubacteria bacterium]
MPYPSELTHTVTLTDGSRVLVRAIRPDDADRLTALYQRLSRQTIYQRFFTVMPRLPIEWARQLADVDYAHRLALVAERDGTRGVELVAVARYEPDSDAGAGVADPDTGAGVADLDTGAGVAQPGARAVQEVAAVVEDVFQGHGLGTHLLDALLAAGEARGIHRFCAYLLGENRRMAGLLARLTDVHERTAKDGVVRVVFTRHTAPVAA